MRTGTLKHQATEQIVEGVDIDLYLDAMGRDAEKWHPVGEISDDEQSIEIPAVGEAVIDNSPVVATSDATSGESQPSAEASAIQAERPIEATVESQADATAAESQTQTNSPAETVAENSSAATQEETPTESNATSEGS